MYINNNNNNVISLYAEFRCNNSIFLPPIKNKKRRRNETVKFECATCQLIIA